MDRGAWQATVHGIARVGHDVATKPPSPPLSVALHLSSALSVINVPSRKKHKQKNYVFVCLNICEYRRYGQVLVEYSIIFVP